MQANGETITNEKTKQTDIYLATILIGKGAEKDTFNGYLFDSGGNRGEWLYKVTDEQFIISNKGFRYTGKFSNNDTLITGYWETAGENNEWHYWYNKKLVKKK